MTWGTGHQGAVIDYAEWRAKNYSELSVGRLEELARNGLAGVEIDLSPGAKVSLYVQYLKRASGV